MAKIKMNNIGFDNWVIENLKQDTKIAEEYLKTLLKGYEEHGNINIILSGLKHIAKAKGWTWLEKQTGISRRALYDALSENGNPKIKTFLTILNCLGCNISITQQEKSILPLRQY